jgi:hypothetical protein
MKQMKTDNKKWFFYPLLVVCALFICTLRASAAEPETLLGINLDYDKGQVSLWVASNGCTVKSDFVFEMTEGKLTVKRTRRDECKAMPMAVCLTYSFKEAGINPGVPFVITNGFVADPLSCKVR